MLKRLSRAAHRCDDDAGVGMILVIGLSAFMIIIVALLMTIVQNSLAGSRRHNNFDDALTAAESGIDQSLSRIQHYYVELGANYVEPNTGTTLDPNPTCNATITNPTVPFASADAERNYAQQAIATLLAAHPACLEHSSTGDFVAIHPSNEQTVYAEGWAPSRGAASAKARLIKSEYLFAPYAPSNAVLTQGNLALGASSYVTSVTGSDPTEAGVHSNGTVSTSTGQPQVTGLVTSTNTPTATGKFSNPPNVNGKASTSPEQDVPTITASEIYAQNATSVGSAGWYDMCPDGTIRMPSASGPCTGTTEGSGTWRNFTFQGKDGQGVAQWTFAKNVGPGVYYFDDADVSPGGGIGNDSVNNATIIASAVDDSVCPRVGGNVDWEHTDINGPALNGLFIFADGMVTSTSNFNAGIDSGGNVVSGGIVAGEQFNLSTSSSVLVGSLIAEDACNTGQTNTIKGQEVDFDPNGKLPFTSVIDTTLWLEYTGVN